MASRRRRVLRVIDEDDSCSEAEELNRVEDEAAVARKDVDIEVLDSPLHRNSRDRAVRDDFSASSSAANLTFENHVAIPCPSVSNGPPAKPILDFNIRSSTFSQFIPSLPVGRGPSVPVASIASHHAALEALLQNRGVRPVPEWLDSCVERLAASRPGFLQLPVPQQAESCFSHFLVADFNTMGAAVLPPQLHTLHAVELAGPFVLQVDEMSDIGSAIRNRYKERPASSSRCLKLSMTDGAQRAYGIEYRPIRDLNVLSPAGLKIAVHHVTVRRGLLLLVPEVVTILGGQAEHLEAARQKVVQHVNKPPRGRRSRREARPQSLIESASSVAWVTDQSTGTTRSERQPTGQEDQLSRASTASASDMRASDNEGVPLQEGFEETSFTYLSVLKKKWESSYDASEIQGRIKCVLTGVKEFHFKNLEQFRLVVYVDDGSQIASVLIHHHVVERLIGYSPGDVSAALTSSCPNEVIKMKENLSCFQGFLTNFEGFLRLRRGGDATFPVAIEMTEGCQKYEAWHLVERLQGSRESASVNESVPIELSP